MSRSLLVLLVPLLTSCSFTFGSSYPEIDGVKLRAKHVEVLELSAIPVEGLRVDAAIGDLRVESGAGPLRIEVEVYGTVVGDGHAEVVGGALVARSATDQPVAIGAVTIHASADFPRLELATGTGDVEVRGVRVAGALVLATGIGDVAGEPASIRASSGLGDLDLARSAPRSIEASSGMGDVSLDGIVAGEARLESGMGDVRMSGSRFGSLKAATGMGDVRCIDTTYEHGELDSGLGSVDR
jgi:hypothetical protein